MKIVYYLNNKILLNKKLIATYNFIILIIIIYEYITRIVNQAYL